MTHAPVQEDLVACLDFEEALRFWYGRTNYEQRTPQPDDLKLEEMRRLLAALGNPHESLRIIHVAGSKGKGSVSAMLAAVLQREGYRTGLFTSPHLTGPLERIRVDDVCITPQELAQEMTRVHRAVVQEGLNPTFFEVATAVGFLHFQRRRVQAAIVEVGLGGRLDSTNVCQPEVAVISSISFDHMRQLGNTLASIAREKAGILKPGRPAVTGATDPEACDVISQIAHERGVPLRQLGHDFTFDYRPARYQAGSTRDASAYLPRPEVQITTWKNKWPWLELSLLGSHQAANAAVALATIEVLREQDWTISDGAVASALATVSWPARLELLGRSPWILLDCAHNTASIAALAATLEETFPPGRRILVFASSNDKDVPGMLRILAPHFAHACLTRFSDNPRAVAPDELAISWKSVGGSSCSCHESPAEALAKAQATAGPEDLVCITGSVFLAGELRPVLAGPAAAT